MDPDEERPTSPVSSLLANEVPSPRSDRSRSENGLLKSVSGIGAEMIYSNLNYIIPVKGQREGKQIIKNCKYGFVLFIWEFLFNIVFFYFDFRDQLLPPSQHLPAQSLQ